MRLEVLHDYDSLSVRDLPKGIYEMGDPRLKNRERYLVQNGHAVWLDGPPPDDDHTTVPDEDLGLSEKLGAAFNNIKWRDEDGDDEDVTPENGDEVVAADKEKLHAMLDEMNVEYDARWGVARLQDLLNEAVG